jgi:hypothetical protein
MLSRRAIIGSFITSFAAFPASANDALRLAPGALDSSRINADDAKIALTPLQARTMATRAANSIKSISDAHVIGVKQLVAQRQGLADGRRQIDQLKKEKDDAVRELRMGLFCSRCRQSKSEIEAKGETFEDHLQKVRGDPIGATPEEIADKEAHYDALITQAVRDQGLRQKNYNASIVRQEDYTEQIKDGLKLWKSATSIESWLLQKEEEKLDRRDEREQKTAQSNIQQLSKDLEGMSGSDARSAAKQQEIQASKDRWEQILAGSKHEANRRSAEHFKKIVQADQQANYDYKNIRNALDKVLPGPGFTAPSFSISAPVPSTPGVQRVSVNVTPESAGLTFQFEKVVSAGVETVFDRSERSQETRIFFEAFNHYISFGEKTEETVNGQHVTQPTFDFGTKESAPKSDYNLNIPSPSKKFPVP